MTKEQIEKITSGRLPQKLLGKKRILFVRPGQQSFYNQKQSTTNDTAWNGKWEIGADLEGCERFFPIPTPKKPDIVVWCTERKIVYLVELTVPHEDNIDAAHLRKNDRYEKLIQECEEAGWSATNFSVEAGCRGFIGQRLESWFQKIGLNYRERGSAMKEIQKTVENVSHWIWHTK